MQPIAALRAENRSEMANGESVRQVGSDVDAFCDAQSIFQFDAQIAHCAVDFGVTKQQLDRAKITGLSVDLCRLCPAERMRAIRAWFQTNRLYPFTDEPTILARRNVQAVVEPARKHELARKHLGRVDPRQDGVACVFRQLKLDGFLCFALDDRNPYTHAIIFYQVDNREFDKIATAQLAVDGDVEQSQITKIPRKFEPGAYCPNLLGQQRSLLTDNSSLVPSLAFGGDCGKLDSWHDLPSDPPSCPVISTALTAQYYMPDRVAGFEGLPYRGFLPMHWTDMSPFD